MSGGGRVVEYRWFPASAGCGLLGGICAPSPKEAEAFNTHDKGCVLVRVRLEYVLPDKLPEGPAHALEEAYADNVTSIRPPPSIDDREDELVYVGHLMRQAMRAAIDLTEDVEAPGLAVDVLRLAADRWDSLREGHLRDDRNAREARP